LAFLYVLKAGVCKVQLVINGESRDVSEVSTVTDLLVLFKLEQKILVVELNREIIERDHYEVTVLKDGDRLEIVHFVGGG
jgi:thiamine biosynthesis protein ThiS